MANSVVGVNCGMDHFDKRFGQVISSDVVHPVELAEDNFVEAVEGDADFVKKLVPFAADDKNSNCEKKKQTTLIDFNGMPVNDPLPIFPLSMTLEDVFKTMQADVRFLPTLVALKNLNLKIPQLLIDGNIPGRGNRYGIADANEHFVFASSGVARHKKKVKMSEEIKKDVYLRAIDNIKSVSDGAAVHIAKLSDNISKLSDNIKSVSETAAAHIAKLSEGAAAHIDVLRMRDENKAVTSEDVLMTTPSPTEENNGEGIKQ